MILGERIRQLRRETNLSQGDVEKRTGLLRCYTSRVEGGHTVPSLETIQKYAHAFRIPLYRFFVTDGNPDVHSLPVVPITEEGPSISSRIDEEIRRFANLFARIKHADRALILQIAFLMARKHRRSRPARAGRLRNKVSVPGSQIQGAAKNHDKRHRLS